MLYTNDLVNEFKSSPPQNIFAVTERLFPELSEKEAETLYWLAYGLHTTDVSVIMQAKKNTIKTYVNRCKYKLNSDSITDLRLIFHSRLHSFTLSITFNYNFYQPLKA